MLWWTLRKLRRGDSRQRSDAVRSLGHSKNPRTVDALIAILGTPGEYYSTPGADNLSFRAEYAEAREGAAEALGSLNDPRAIEPLVAALNNDKSEKTRRYSARSLASIGGPRVQQALEEKLRNGDEDRYVVDAVAVILVGLGEAAQPAIAAAIKDERAVIRRSVAQAMRYARDPRFTSLLEELLKDSDPDVREYAGKGLVDIAKQAMSGNEAATAPLAILLAAVEPGNDIPDGVFEFEFIRERVRTMLDRIPQSWWQTMQARSTVPVLIEKARHDSNRVRVAAVESLGRIKDASARDTLAAFLYGDINSQRANDIELAGGFDAAKEALDAIDPSWKHSARSELKRLVANLVHVDPGTRGHAGSALHAIDPDWTKADYVADALPAMLFALRK